MYIRPRIILGKTLLVVLFAWVPFTGAYASSDSGVMDEAVLLSESIFGSKADSTHSDLPHQHDLENGAPIADTNPAFAKEDWERILDTMDSLVAELESTAFRPAEPAEDSGTWIHEGDWPTFSEDILRERLATIPTTIPLTYNSTVKSWIEMYTMRNRAGIQRMLGLRELYFPIIEEELDRRNLPMELKYLAVIESALNTHAVSPQGATGLWQIMYPTAKGLGLRIDTYVDERRDPYRATEAALDYLEQLYGIYEDWLLVVAAYNCGPGNVNKAIRKAGGKRDVWQIFSFLPRETRGYVPAFISAAYTFTYYKEHDFTPWKSRFNYTYCDTVMIRENTSFSFIADQLEMTEDEIRYFNPSLRRGVVPGNSGYYPLRLPYDKAMTWVTRKETISATDVNVLAEAPNTTISADQHSATTNETTRIYYSVKSGDNLTYIASWYGVGVSDLRDWNKLSGNTIRVGQKLVILKSAQEAPRYHPIASMSFAEKQRTNGNGANPVANRSTSSGDSPTLVYKVKSGDTLWSIARAHPGNSIDSIARLNGISTRSTLKTGMTLKLNR